MGGFPHLLCKPSTPLNPPLLYDEQKKSFLLKTYNNLLGSKQHVNEEWLLTKFIIINAANSFTIEFLDKKRILEINYQSPNSPFQRRFKNSVVIRDKEQMKKKISYLRRNVENFVFSFHGSGHDRPHLEKEFLFYIKLGIINYYIQSSSDVTTNLTKS